VPVSSLPRDEEGGIRWTEVSDDTKDKFMRSHRRIWIDPVLVGSL